MSSPNYMYGKIPAEAPDAEWVRRDYKFNEENLINEIKRYIDQTYDCLLYTSPSPRDS